MLEKMHGKEAGNAGQGNRFKVTVCVRLVK